MSCDCVNTVISIASELINDLDNDSSLSASYISSWLRSNIGKLNNLISTSFELDNSMEFTPCMDDNQKDIYKDVFFCHYWSLQAKANLGAAAYSLIEVAEGDSKVRVASKTDNAKVFAGLVKDCQSNLKDMARFYKLNKCLPKSISSATTNMYLYSRENDN